MAMYLAKQILISGNPKAIAAGVKGVLVQDPASLMKAFLYLRNIPHQGSFQIFKESILLYAS